VGESESGAGKMNPNGAGKPQSWVGGEGEKTESFRKRRKEWSQQKVAKTSKRKREVDRPKFWGEKELKEVT